MEEQQGQTPQPILRPVLAHPENIASQLQDNTRKALDLATLPKATKRGKGMCRGVGCSYYYSNRRKPSTCPQCGFYLGGSHHGPPKDDTPISYATKLTSGTLCEGYDLYSVKISRRGRDYRCLVQVSQNSNNHICYYDKCRVQRSASVISNSSGFECEHVKVAKECAVKADEIPLSDVVLLTLPFPSSMREELSELAIRATEAKIPAVQQVSLSNYVVICERTDSNPLGLLHLRVDNSRNKFTCGEDGTRTSAKPYRSKCVHYCLYKWGSNFKPVNTLEVAQAQYPIPDAQSPVCSAPKPTNNTKVLQRNSTVQLLRNLVKIPEDAASLAPIFRLVECKNAGLTALLNRANSNSASLDLHFSEMAWKTHYEPEEESCKLCGSAMSETLHVQGSNGEGWLVTMTHVIPVTFRIKKCLDQECMAIHSYHGISTGLFNIANKLLVSLDILFLIREHVKQGLLPILAAEAILSMTLAKSPTAAAKIDKEKRRYIEQHLFKGYWAYECLTVRNTDDAICGLCGVAPKVEIAESTSKDCISLAGIKIKWPETPPLSEEHVDVDGFWAEMENKTLEQAAFASVDLITEYNGTKVAPFISPAYRSDKVINTDALKVQGRSAGNIACQSFQGNPSKLAEMVQQGALVPAQLAEYTHNELFALCQRCDMPVNATDTRNILQSYLEGGCQFLSAGKSTCHAFASGAVFSGGRVSKSCPHQVVTATKFLMRQESTRDHVDLLRSCKYWPPVYIVNMACSVAQHVSYRYPALATQLWGGNQGCFQPPSPYQDPQRISCPELQMTELQNTPTPLVDPKDHFTHPATGRKERRILTARIGDKGGVHQLKTCEYHNVELCPELVPYKASIMLSGRGPGASGTRQRDTRRRGASNLCFHQYFLYGRLMDYFNNLAIVKEQLELISKQCSAGETIVRDKFQRFVIVCSKCYLGGHVAKDCPYNTPAR